MKSSSDLFPVSLMRADVIDDTYIEDTYLIKPNNSPDQTVQIAVTRLGYYEAEGARGTPVILIHGAFSNRNCWMQPYEKGVAKTLLEQGFDPWMIDLRGHGDSPVNQQYKHNSLEHYAKYDLPAIQAFVFEKNPKPAVWGGHSWGGVLIATSIASNTLDTKKIKSLLLLGSQVTRYPMLLRMPVTRLVSRIWTAIGSEHYVNKLGPEAEPKGVAKEFVRWSSLLFGWRDSNNNSLKKAWVEQQLPVLAVAASKDKSDPAKHCKRLLDWAKNSTKADFILAGKSNNFSRDYNHKDLVASQHAQEELWPKICNWINDI